MDLTQAYRDMLLDLGGANEAAKHFGITKEQAVKYYERKEPITLSIAEKVIDSRPSDDGSTADFTIDEDGISNYAYCPPEWGRKKAKWEGRDVCLCLPTMQYFPHQTVYCLLATVMRYRMAIRLEMRGDDSMITRSRNHLAKRFLDTGATWSIWFDSDMTFPFGQSKPYMTLTNMRNIPDQFLGVHAIERMIGWGKTLVGGCYWDRRGGGKLIAGGGNIMKPIPHNSINPIGFNGTGCLAIHRQVFLDIAKKFPETFNPNAPGNECGFFTNIQGKDGRMLGEDESLAWRANEAGHPTFLDLGLLCGHVGTGNVHAIPAQGSRI